MFFNSLLPLISSLPLYEVKGHVKSVVGVLIEVVCPSLSLDEICHIYSPDEADFVEAQVVGFKEHNALVMPFSRASDICFGCKVSPTGNKFSIQLSQLLKGRIINAYGKPIDGKGAISYSHHTPYKTDILNPLERDKISISLETGVSAIDCFTTIGKGQRIALFAGSGVGKSSLLGAISSNITEQINVIALIGERGREVEEFIDDVLGEQGLKNAIVVVATADEAPLTKINAVNTAISIAEYFSNNDEDVLFMMDSITRYAIALRDVGLAVGETPTLKGYTSSVFSKLPEIIERFGSFKNKGTITAILTVLIEGGDIDDPIVDAVRAIVDGHIVLTRELAERGHYPAIDVLKSTSRLFTKLNNKEHQKMINVGKGILASYEDSRELFELSNEEEKQSNKVFQQAKALLHYLQQDIGEFRLREMSDEQLHRLTMVNI